MMRVIWREIAPAEELPGFGAAFLKRMEQKTHPQLRAASLAAWSLLARELRALDRALPEVAYTANGKPYLRDCELHFSLAHSGRIAAVMLADAPCGIDVELLRPDMEERLRARCMHPAERAAGLDFFEVWTRKECIAKLTGRGLPSRPSRINSLPCPFLPTQRPTDSMGGKYVLSALCGNLPEIML